MSDLLYSGARHTNSKIMTFLLGALGLLIHYSDGRPVMDRRLNLGQFTRDGSLLKGRYVRTTWLNVLTWKICWKMEMIWKKTCHVVS